VSDFPPLGELLPHTGAMALLEAVVSHDAATTVCSARIGPDHVFADPDGSVPSWVGLELMAQCAAVHGGLVARSAGEPVRPGLLLGSRRLSFATPAFSPGQRLRVRATHHRGATGLVAFDAEVSDAESHTPLAEGRINVYLLRDWSDLGEVRP
jgi:predicted hotdog family 3-hydroxylacyl-ACP dehydratase